MAMTERDERGRGGTARVAPPSIEEVAERAARLGITPERVLEEYARIAFASLRDIADWGPGKDGLQVKPSCDLTRDPVAAIAEIVASASSGKIYRIKMHDKKPVLDAMARHLGLLEKLKDGQSDDDGEEAREFLIEELDRLAAEVAGEEGDPEASE
jgi:phage terminase small subunit